VERACSESGSEWAVGECACAESRSDVHRSYRVSESASEKSERSVVPDPAVLMCSESERPGGSRR
jgi:hypothetical protein